MPNYDRQFICLFLTGDASDKYIWETAELMNDRAKRKGINSHRLTMPISVQSERHNSKRHDIASVEIPKLTRRSRLYLTGHGDWKEMTLGNWVPEEVVDLLGHYGLKEVGVISIDSCSLGRDATTAGGVRLGRIMNSFASNLHRELKTSLGIETIVKARTYDVSTVTDALIEGGLNFRLKGAKVVWDSLGVDHQRAGSKIVLEWKDGRQVRDFAY